MARPTKRQQAAIRQRNKRIVNMRNTGYPVTYIAEIFSLTKGTVSSIIKNNKN